MTSTDTAINIPARGNITNGVDRILSVPRFRAYYSVGLPGFGPGAAYMPWNVVEYDSDGMCQAQPQITCQTTGLYWVKGMVAWTNAVFTQWLWVRLIVNGNTSLTPGNVTNQGISTSFGTFIEASGHWNAKKGDTIAVYIYSNAAADITGGRYGCAIEGHLVSTVP